MGPAGVANHTHQTVSVYQSAIKSIVQPSMARTECHEPSYPDASTKSGTKPPSITSPVSSNHPKAIITAASDTSKKFRNIFIRNS